MEKSRFGQHKELIERAIQAINERTFYTPYPEHHKAWGEENIPAGKAAFEAQLNSPFNELVNDEPKKWVGEEVSPYTAKPLGITYSALQADHLVEQASQAMKIWRKVSVEERAGLLVEALERIKSRFFELAYATMHTTGQSFMMAFQASGPHASDRALEALALGYHEATRFSGKVIWEKPMGKHAIKLEKNFKAVPRGISLAIGCSTFPVWNTVPGVFASLVTGNPVIVKPHPGAILPIAIVLSEIQKVLKEDGYDPNVVQLAPDTKEEPIAKKLAEHEKVKIIDYTGSSHFGRYIEGLNKITFTEKAGVNSVILDSVQDLDAVLQNLSFSLALFSGQMCTAPQNFFIPETGIKEGETIIPYEEVVQRFRNHVDALVNNEKIGPGTLAAIQNNETLDRAKEIQDLEESTTLLEGSKVVNPEFEDARTCSPIMLEVDAANKDIYEDELFGPISVIVKTKNTEESITIASEMAATQGAITCGAYTTDPITEEKIAAEMEAAFVQVSFNLTGFIWVNQAAAFSDFHVSGGNPAGNASFANPDFVNKRFVWIGHRKLM